MLKMAMPVQEIVRRFLKDGGYDGLCANECGCSVNCLFPCVDGPFPNCKDAVNKGAVVISTRELVRKVREAGR